MSPRWCLRLRPHLVDSHRTAGQVIGQITRQQAHHQVGATRFAPEIMQRNDVGVLKTRDQLRLCVEPLRSSTEAWSASVPDGNVASAPVTGVLDETAMVPVDDGTRELGLGERTGIHLGEVEQRGTDIGGIAVNLAARVMGEARPGEIVVSSTVVDTSIGGTFGFEPLGLRDLRGIDRRWSLFVLDTKEP